ncbi:hypothetical protein EZV62_000765 [Acer yangbiense]|uniref:Integrase catalytic domain-containing protein n=1 Tax=Acer yangbiense TaxID=1000413 RepID=A0A5C7IUQ3_9ROSI|nr:hypothetical protein EZV62_000765 [Acer yangbiense]
MSLILETTGAASFLSQKSIIALFRSGYNSSSSGRRRSDAASAASSHYPNQDGSADVGCEKERERSGAAEDENVTEPAAVEYGDGRPLPKMTNDSLSTATNCFSAQNNVGLGNLFASKPQSAYLVNFATVDATQNGVAERKHRHIVETGLTLLAHAKMPLKFWHEAFSTAVFLINNMPIATFKFTSPFEKLYHKKPNYTFFKTFGSSNMPLSTVQRMLSHVPCFVLFDTIEASSLQPSPLLSSSNLNSSLTVRSNHSPMVSFMPSPLSADDYISATSTANPSPTVSAQAPPNIVSIHPMQTRSNSGIFSRKFSLVSTWSKLIQPQQKLLFKIPNG